MTWQHNKIIGIGLCITICLSGCSQLDVNYKNERSPIRPSERVLGSISYQENLVSDPKQIHFYKIRKGYAFKANMDREKDYESNLMLSKDKEFDWFAGMKWQWTF